MFFNPLYQILLFIFLSGTILFATTWAHILTTLISLEFMSLALYFLFSSVPILGSKEFFVSILFLALAVCEGALGLSILVLFTRLKGNELLKSSSALLW